MVLNKLTVNITARPILRHVIFENICSRDSSLNRVGDISEVLVVLSIVDAGVPLVRPAILADFNTEGII
jgi:hypothetical protein